MAQTCRVCAHPKTKEIEEAIVQDVAHTTIGDRYGIHFQSVRYHAENHLPEKLVRSVQKEEQRHAENMLDGINDLLDRTRQILDKAEAKGQKSLALKAIKEARGTYELLSKIAVKLEEYRREDEAKEEQHTTSQINEGLQALTTQELKAFIQLQAKIFAATPDHKLDPSARYVVEAITKNGYASDKKTKGETKTKAKANTARNHSQQDKNSQITRSDDGLDLDLDDLSLDDLEKDNTIPSEETDPSWLRRERRRRRRRNR